MKFVQFTPEQSINILLGYARHYAFADLHVGDRMRIDPRRGETPLGPRKMLDELGAHFEIDFTSPENEQLANSMIAEYRDIFRDKS
jgi:hypothetical protein